MEKCTDAITTASVEENKVSLSMLPDEVLLKIFQYLDMCDMASVASLFPKCPSLLGRANEFLTAREIDETSQDKLKQLFNMADFCRFITYLDFSNCVFLSEQYLESYISVCNELRVLKIVNTNVTTSCLWRILWGKVSTLEELACSFLQPIEVPKKIPRQSFSIMDMYVEVPPLTSAFETLRRIIFEWFPVLLNLHIHVCDICVRNTRIHWSPLMGIWPVQEPDGDSDNAPCFERFTLSSSVRSRHGEDIGMLPLNHFLNQGCIYLETDDERRDFVDAVCGFSTVQVEEGKCNFFFVTTDRDPVVTLSDHLTLQFSKFGQPGTHIYIPNVTYMVLQRDCDRNIAFPHYAVTQVVPEHIVELNLVDYHCVFEGSFWRLLSRLRSLKKLALPGCSLPPETNLDGFSEDEEILSDGEGAPVRPPDIHPAMYFAKCDLPLDEFDIRMEYCNGRCNNWRKQDMYKLENLNSLETLTVSLPCVGSLEFCRGLSSLKMLRARQHSANWMSTVNEKRYKTSPCRFSENISDILETLPELRALRLEHSRLLINDCELWEAIVALPKLRYLCLSSTAPVKTIRKPPYDIGMICNYLQRMPNLKLLHLHCVSVNRDKLKRQIRKLKNCPKYLIIEAFADNGFKPNAQKPMLSRPFIGRDFCLMPVHIGKPKPQSRDELWSL